MATEKELRAKLYKSFIEEHDKSGRRRLAVKKWRERHPEKEKEYQKKSGKKWRETHPEQNKRKLKEYYYKNRKELTKKIKEYQRTHLEKFRHYNQQRYSREKGAEGSHTLEEWEKLKKEFEYKCRICSKREPFIDLKYQWLVRDHIIPLFKGGTNFINNIQPLCWRCNSIKKAQIYGNGERVKSETL